MARNRKSQPAAIRFGPALKAFLLCLLIGGSGVGYVWQKDQIARLGQKIRVGETALDRARDENEKLRKQLAAMRSPAFLEARIRQLDLGLAAPAPAKIWRLPEPAGEPAPPAGPGQYVARSPDAAALGEGPR